MDELEHVRRNPISDELRQKVAAELHELEVAGKTYRFKLEPRCRVCQDPRMRAAVNLWLARGLSLKEIVTSLEPLNAERRERDRVSQQSVYNHKVRHFALDEPAQAVYRNILEKEALALNMDIVEGVGAQISVYAYLKTVGAKGYQTLTDNNTRVTIDQGMQAMLKLNELMKDDADAAQIAEAWAQLNLIMRAVNQVTTLEQQKEIKAILSGLDDVLDVDSEELDDEDNEPFDPTKNMEPEEDNE